jgi:hypothetical protein
MIEWITSAGNIGSVSKGSTFSYTLSLDYDNSITSTKIISGTLPSGLTYNNLLIAGTVSLLAAIGTYSFTIRATSNSVVTDRTYNIIVTHPIVVSFPNANLGIWPVAQELSISIAANVYVPEYFGNIEIISGSLPSNLSLDANSGIISGIVFPSVLYNTANIYQNMESNKPELAGSASSYVYSFDIQYTTNVTANYNITITSSESANGNISLYSYSDYETPTGLLNGNNKSFVILYEPSPIDDLYVYLNGVMLNNTSDFSISGNTISMISAPESSDSIIVFYSYLP